MMRKLLIYAVAAIPSVLILWAVGTIVVNLINAIYGFHTPLTNNANVTPIVIR